MSTLLIKKLLPGFIILQQRIEYQKHVKEGWIPVEEKVATKSPERERPKERPAKYFSTYNTIENKLKGEFTIAEDLTIMKQEGVPGAGD